MSMMQIPPRPIRTLADLLDRLGGVPLDRIRFRPPPGSATLQDVIDIRQREGILCELVEGVLLEKVMGYEESAMGGFLLTHLNIFVLTRNLGIVDDTLDGGTALPGFTIPVRELFAELDREEDTRKETQ